MGARELIEAVRTRLASIRRVNLFLAHFFSFPAVVLLFELLNEHLVPRPLELPVIALVVLVILALVERTSPWLRAPTPTDAALLLDAQLSGKERFLTVATVPAPGLRDHVPPSLRVVEEQSDSIASGFAPSERIPFRLEPTTRLSLIGSTLLLLILLVVPEKATRASLSHSELQMSQTAAESLRETLAMLPAIPAEVRTHIEKLADAIEQTGFYSDASLDALENALETIRDIEEREPELTEQLSRLKLPDTSRELMQEEERTLSQPKPESQMRSETTPPSKAAPREPSRSDEKQRMRTSRAGGEVERRASPKETLNADEGESKTEEKTSSQAPDSYNRRSGDTSHTDEQMKNRAEESNQQARQKQGGTRGGENLKKDLTGVGEGQGRGKTGDEKEQHGRAKSGKDQGGAKEGDATHPEESPNSGGQSTPGQERAHRDEGGAEQPNSLRGKSPRDEKSQRGKRDLGPIKDKLSQMKEQMEKGPGPREMEQRAGSGQTVEQSGPASNTQDQEERSDRAGEEHSQKQPGQEEGGDTNRASRTAEPSTPKRSGAREEQTTLAERPDNSKGAPSGANDQKRTGNPRSDAGARDDAPAGRVEQRSPQSPDGRGSDRAGPDSPQFDENAKSPRPERLPRPGEQGNRFGPFEGGDQGAIDISGSSRDKVVIPLEERIDVRSLGREDPELFRNAPGSKAKTALSNEDFKKPVPNTAAHSQPIPVEYRDLLR